MKKYQLPLSIFVAIAFAVPIQKAAAQQSNSAPVEKNFAFHLRIEQDGKIFETDKHIVFLKKAPFTFVFDLDDTDTNIQLNASFNSETFRALSRNISLEKLQEVFGVGTGYAEEHYTQQAPPRFLHVEDAGSHYWFYQKLQRGEEHRYNSIKRIGNIIEARRTVEGISVFEGSDLFTRKNTVILLENLKKSSLYLSVIYGTPNAAPNYDTHELSRQYVKIRFR